MEHIRLNMTFKMSSSKKAVMYDDLYVPKLACNLLKVRTTAKRGNTENLVKISVGSEVNLDLSMAWAL